MADPLSTNLRAAQHRLDAAGRAADDIAQRDALQKADLDGLEARLESLARAHAIAMPETAPPMEIVPAALSGDDGSVVAPDYAAVATEYDRILIADEALLAEQGIAQGGWEDLLGAGELEGIRAHLSRPLRPEGMTKGDWITLGVCGGLGAVAVLLDDLIDNGVKNRMMALHDRHSPGGQGHMGNLIRQWDHDGKNLAIDYSGPGIGGGHGVHRVRSSGHDLFRPLSAIRQIRTGQFDGHDWSSGVQIPIFADSPRPGWASYRQVETTLGPDGALILWLKHLASDFTTSKSLPLPGASFLHEMPWHTARSIGAESYKAGLNLRRVAVSGIFAVAVVELGIRLSVYLRNWLEHGSLRLSPERRAKMENMLLMGHGLVAATSVGKVALRWTAEGPAALRHVNLGVLIATARYGTKGIIRYLQRTDPARIYARNEGELTDGWEALLLDYQQFPTLAASFVDRGPAAVL